MIGNKLLWTGATLILAAPALSIIPSITTVGAIIMLIGLVLFWMDK